jgi:hypothetical protein
VTDFWMMNWIILKDGMSAIYLYMHDYINCRNLVFMDINKKYITTLNIIVAILGLMHGILPGKH